MAGVTCLDEAEEQHVRDAAPDVELPDPQAVGRIGGEARVGQVQHEEEGRVG